MIMRLILASMMIVLAGTFTGCSGGDGGDAGGDAPAAEEAAMDAPAEDGGSADK